MAGIACLPDGIDEPGKKTKLLGAPEEGGLETDLSGARTIQEMSELEVRDLPCFEYMTMIVVRAIDLRCLEREAGRRPPPQRHVGAGETAAR